MDVGHKKIPRWQWLNVLLLLLFSTSIFAQKEGYKLYEGSSPDDPIRILEKQDNKSNRILSFLQFNSKQKGEEGIIRPTFTYSMSPNGLLVARLTDGPIGHDALKSRYVDIFDQYGNRTAFFPVAPLDRIALADDGRIAIYGQKNSFSITFDSYLYLYNRNGTLHTFLEEVFGLEHIAKFGNDGTLAFLVNTNRGLNIKCKNVMYIYDKTFKLTKKHLFEEWPLIKIPNSNQYVSFRFREILFTENGNIKIPLSYGKYKFNKHHSNFYLFDNQGKMLKK